MNALEDKNEALDHLGLGPPYESNYAEGIILGKALDMAYAGSGVEAIQKTAQKSCRELAERDRRGEIIDW